MGSGPFQVVEVKKGSYMRLVANKHYWGGAPKVDEVIFQVYQNAETMVDDLRSGASRRPNGSPSPSSTGSRRRPA